jgi:hypothetical protein
LSAAWAQDIVERWSEITRTNSIETLGILPFLTQSSFAVPDRLAPELKGEGSESVAVFAEERTEEIKEEHV